MPLFSEALALLNSAIKKVPAVKWALAVAALAAAAAIVKGFLGNPLTAWLTIAGLLILMAVLVLFSVAARLPALKKPALVFVWFTVVFFIALCILSASYIFSGYPAALDRFFKPGPPEPSAVETLDKLVSQTRGVLASYESLKGGDPGFLKEIRESAPDLAVQLGGLGDNLLPAAKILERDLWTGIAHTLSALSEKQQDAAFSQAQSAIAVLDRGLAGQAAIHKLSLQTPPTASSATYQQVYAWTNRISYRDAGLFNRALARGVLAQQDAGAIKAMREDFDRIDDDYLSRYRPTREPLVAFLCGLYREGLGDRVCGLPQ